MVAYVTSVQPPTRLQTFILPSSPVVTVGRAFLKLVQLSVTDDCVKCGTVLSACVRQSCQKSPTRISANPDGMLRLRSRPLIRMG